MYNTNMTQHKILMCDIIKTLVSNCNCNLYKLFINDAKTINYK